MEDTPSWDRRPRERRTNCPVRLVTGGFPEKSTPEGVLKEQVGLEKGQGILGKGYHTHKATEV